MSSTATDVNRPSVEAATAFPHEKSHHNLNVVNSHNGITISPELFEKLYLTPKTPRKGDANRRFANAVPMGFTGFVISTFTFSMILMGFGNASSLAGVVGIFFFTGPVLLGLAAIFEWIMGNFFTMNSLSLFCVFWLSFGMIQLPSLGVAASYSPTGNATEGAASPDFNSAVGLYLIVWGFAFVTYFVFSLKTNSVFAGIFGFAAIAVYILAGAYFKVAAGDYVMAGHLQVAGGALLFVVAVLGWYITFVIMAAEMRLGINFPVGDLSHFWPSTDVELTEIEKQA